MNKKGSSRGAMRWIGHDLDAPFEQAPVGASKSVCKDISTAWLADVIQQRDFGSAGGM